MPKGIYIRKPGIRLSKKHRDKISHSLRGKKKPLFTQEHRDNIGKASRSRKYPSRKLKSPEDCAKISLNHRMRRPEERIKHSKAIAAAHARGVYRKSPTNLEKALNKLLSEAGFIFEEQVQFDRCTVDVWVPSHRLVFEADGEPWHAWNEAKNPGYHKRRDAFLKSQGVLAIVHLSGPDLLPWIPSP